MKKLIAYLLENAKLHGIRHFSFGTVILQREKTLLLKCRTGNVTPDIYNIPCGKITENEDVFADLDREIFQATKLKNCKVSDYLNYFDTEDSNGIKNRQFNFVIQYNDNSPLQLDVEKYSGYLWITRAEMQYYPLTTEVKNLLQGYYLTNCEIPRYLLIKQALEEGIQRFVVGAVVAKGDKILCLKRASTDFMGGIDELPSGRVEIGESLESALVREIKEETNLNIAKISDYLGHFDYSSKSGNKTRQFNFVVIPTIDAQVGISSEHEGFAWISTKEIDRYQLSGEVKNIIKQYFSVEKPTATTHFNTFLGPKRTRDPQEDITEQKRSTKVLRLNSEVPSETPTLPSKL
jgi:8-oxo-dGTP diphosphatase